MEANKEEWRMYTWTHEEGRAYNPSIFTQEQLDGFAGTYMRAIERYDKALREQKGNIIHVDEKNNRDTSRNRGLTRVL